LLLSKLSTEWVKVTTTLLATKTKRTGLKTANQEWDNLPSTLSLLILLPDSEISNSEEAASETCLTKFWTPKFTICGWLLMKAMSGPPTEMRRLWTTDLTRSRLRLPPSTRSTDIPTQLRCKLLYTQRKERPAYLPLSSPSSSIPVLPITITNSLIPLELWVLTPVRSVRPNVQPLKMLTLVTSWTPLMCPLTSNTKDLSPLPHALKELLGTLSPVSTLYPSFRKTPLMDSGWQTGASDPEKETTDLSSLPTAVKSINQTTRCSRTPWEPLLSWPVLPLPSSPPCSSDEFGTIFLLLKLLTLL